MSDDLPIPTFHPFQGFDIPRQNWFKMPNHWTDVTADIGSIAELKVVEYVLKHTWGYQEYGLRKKITNDEFMHGRRRKDGTRLDKGTGLSKPSVIAGLKSAVERGLLIEEIDDSDKARVKKYYSLRMMPGHEDESTENDPLPPETQNARQGKDQGVKDLNAGVKDLYPGVKDLNAGVKDLYPGVKDLYPRGKDLLPRTEKDTLVRHSQEETNSNNNNDSAIDEPSLPNAAVVVVLINFGIGKKVAQKLAEEHTEAYIREKIASLEFLQGERPEEVQKPAGWLRRAIEENYGPPDGFVAQAERERLAVEKARIEQEEFVRAQADEVAHQQEQAQQMAKTQAYRAWLDQTYDITQPTLDFWRQALVELEFAFSLRQDVFKRYIQTAEILQVTAEEVRLGFSDEYLANHVTHPGTKKLIERALSTVAGRPLQVHFEVIAATVPADGAGTSQTTDLRPS